MKNQTSPTGNYAYCSVLPLEINRDIQASGATVYLQFIDDMSGVIKMGGLTRRPVQPTLEELKTLQARGAQA